MLCIFTAIAEDDLENIADYIAIDNPARGDRRTGVYVELLHQIAHFMVFLQLESPQQKVLLTHLDW